MLVPPVPVVLMLVLPLPLLLVCVLILLVLFALLLLLVLVVMLVLLLMLVLLDVTDVESAAAWPMRESSRTAGRASFMAASVARERGRSPFLSRRGVSTSAALVTLPILARGPVMAFGLALATVARTIVIDAPANSAAALRAGAALAGACARGATDR